jgi:hypothetical protein
VTADHPWVTAATSIGISLGFAVETPVEEAFESSVAAV